MNGWSDTPCEHVTVPPCGCLYQTNFWLLHSQIGAIKQLTKKWWSHFDVYSIRYLQINKCISKFTSYVSHTFCIRLRTIKPFKFYKSLQRFTQSHFGKQEYSTFFSLFPLSTDLFDWQFDWNLNGDKTVGYICDHVLMSPKTIQNSLCRSFDHNTPVSAEQKHYGSFVFCSGSSSA